MKRLLGFVLGAVLGISTGYLLRRLLNRPSVAPASLSNVKEVPIIKPASESIKTETGEMASRPSAKFTVRRTGPRPQAPSVEEVVSTANGTADLKDNSEVVAETKTEMHVIEETAATLVAPEVVTEVDSVADDLKIIYDLGEISNRKLIEAGITTFEGLAKTPVEKVAEITELPVARIKRNNWIEQAERLAAGLPIEEFQKQPQDKTE